MLRHLTHNPYSCHLPSSLISLLKVSISIWNHVAKSPSRYLPARAVLINPSSQTILVCWSANTETLTIIHFCRYTYAGEKIGKDSTYSLECCAFPLQFSAVDRCGGFRLCLRTVNEDWHGMSSLAFTEQSNKFEDREGDSMLNLRETSWKDTTYRIYKKPGGLQVLCCGTRCVALWMHSFRSHADILSSSQINYSPCTAPYPLLPHFFVGYE